MENVVMSNGCKEYDHAESKRLLGEVREFFQKKMKLIVPEWSNRKEVVTDAAEENVLASFYMEQAANPIYQGCNGYDDVDVVLDLFDQRLNDLLGNLDALLDNNRDLDEESKNSLESYTRAVEKCLTVYEIQRKRRMAKFKELSTVDEIREELGQFFSEIISNYIISVLFDGLYERIRNDASQIYKMIVREANEFLAENGVYTRSVHVGDPIDPECMEPTSDSAENFTSEFQKFETVDEIYRYPYFFSDGIKIADGRVRIWRRRD